MVNPGDRVTLTGIYRATPVRLNPRQRSVKRLALMLYTSGRMTSIGRYLFNAFMFDFEIFKIVCMFFLILDARLNQH